MTFDEAEARFRELYARVRRGEPIGRASYEEQVSQLAVQADGLWWEIHPHNGVWMYFDGSHWVEAAPPGHTLANVIDLPTQVKTFPEQSTVPVAATPTITQPTNTGAGNRLSIPHSERLSSRVTRRNQLASKQNRTWIPLAVGAGVFFTCAILLLVGGNFALSAFAPTTGAIPTRTRTAAVAVLNTPTIGVPSVAPTAPVLVVTPTPQPVTAKVIEARVNVRATPNTQAQILGTVQRNDVLTLTGKNADGQWYQTTIQNRAAWVFAATLEISSGNASTLPVVASP